MPLPKLPSKFLNSIKDRALDRLKDRLKTEFDPTRLYEDSDVPQDEQVSQGLGQRIKETVKDKLKGLSPVQRYMLRPDKALDEATMKFRIQYAAQNRLLILMRYNNQERHCEVYSYRTNGKPDYAGGPPTLRLYAYCRIHDKIHAFNPKKIQGLLVTDIPYAARWQIEIG